MWIWQIKDDDLSLLDVWCLVCRDTNTWGLESLGSFFAHMSGFWAGVTQRLGSAGTVSRWGGGAYMRSFQVAWASSLHSGRILRSSQRGGTS